MATRLILDATALRVSRTGFDVNTTTPGQNAFDSRRGRYFAVHLQGILVPGAFSAAAAPTISTFVATAKVQAIVWYGKTFATPPVVIACFRSPQDASTGMATFWDDNTTSSGSTTGPGGAYGIGGTSRTIFRSYTDRVVFETTYFNYTFQQPGPSAIAYVVGQY